MTFCYFTSANPNRIDHVGTDTSRTTAAVGIAGHSLTTPLLLTFVYSASLTQEVDIGCKNSNGLKDVSPLMQIVKHVDFSEFGD